MITEVEWDRRLEVQRGLEELSLTQGTKRYFKTLEGAERGERGSVVGATAILLREVVEPLAVALLHKHEEYSKRRGVSPEALQFVHPAWDSAGDTHPDKLGVDTLAYLTSRAVLDSINRKADIKEVSRRLTQMITHELSFRLFQRNAPKLFDYRMERFSSPSYGYRVRTLSHALSIAKCDKCRETGTYKAQEACPHMNTGAYQFTGPQSLRVGAWLIDIMRQATNLIEIDRVIRRGKARQVQKNFVVPTEETREWIDTRDSFLAGLRPVRVPMVVPPVPWSAGSPGGYRFSLRGMFSMVRTAGRPHRETDCLELPEVRDSLNALQETPWQINLTVSLFLDRIEAMGGGFAGLPALDDSPPPAWEDVLPRVLQGDLGDVSPQFRVVYKGAACEIYEVPRLDECRVEQGKLVAPTKEVHRTVDAIYAENRARWKARKFQRQSQAAVYYRMRSVENRLAGEPEVYFPYSLDFRGRIYPLPDYLTPQGTDVEKGLLTFARKDPMGPTGGDWLARHIMNCIDTLPEGRKISTMPDEERIQWVEDHFEMLEAYAMDPFGAGQWGLGTEEPIQLYAACHEWVAWARTDWSEEFLCGLPIGQDGSCNGIQHFAAMLRDPVAAEAVNVASREVPQDVYQRVADAVQRAVAEDPDDMAVLWRSYHRNLIDRKRCKRPTMTFPYGSAVFGFTDQLIEEIQKESDWPAIEAHFGADLMAASRYLANRIWEALDEVVDSAKQAMKWIQQCARIIGRDRPLEWDVPGTGFPVLQGYMECDRVRVNTILASGVRIRADWFEATSKPKLHRQVNASSPNVVHSLDAAHLQMTVVSALAEGVHAFGMVHDSYATTPGQSATLARVLRDEFVNLYSQDILGTLHAQWMTLTDEELPLPPVPGSFNLEEVRTSRYFFA